MICVTDGCDERVPYLGVGRPRSYCDSCASGRNRISGQRSTAAHRSRQTDLERAHGREQDRLRAQERRNKHRDSINQRQRELYDPAKGRLYTLRRHGLTQDRYDEMLANQGGRCAICRSDEPGGRWEWFHVDHDHSCCPGPYACGDCIRGLLCTKCNQGLGLFGDTPEALDRAAGYLLRGGYG